MGANYKQLTTLPNPSYFYFIEKTILLDIFRLSGFVQIIMFCLLNLFVFDSVVVLSKLIFIVKCIKFTLLYFKTCMGMNKNFTRKDRFLN